MARVHAVENSYQNLVGALPPARRAAADVGDIARQIEELRVSLWAQQLGTRARSASSGSIVRFKLWGNVFEAAETHSYGCSCHWPQSWARASLTSTSSPPTTGPGVDAVLTMRW